MCIIEVGAATLYPCVVILYKMTNRCYHYLFDDFIVNVNPGGCLSDGVRL